MKANKSPESTEITPSKKKLKQARLPFMLISDVSPKADAPKGRKRKLSVPEESPVSKIGKSSKENDVKDEVVVLSDNEHESQDVPSPLNKGDSKDQDHKVNPYVKLVDNAMKKLQKGKAQRKSKKPSKKSSNKKSSSKENIEENVPQCDDVEMVEVEVEIHEENAKNDSNKSPQNADKSIEIKSVENNLKGKLEKEETKDLGKRTRSSKSNEPSPIPNSNSCKQSKISPSPNNTDFQEKPINDYNDTRKSPRKNPSASKPVITNEIICLDDSNNSSDVKMEKSQSKENKQTISVSEKSNNSKEIQKSKKETKVAPINTTPKRSGRSIFKADESKLNTSILSSSSSKLDESVSSVPGTPKQDKSSSNLDESMNDSTANISTRNLTPKQMQKKLESAKKREEREKEKLEREYKRQQEKEQRAKEKQEKEDQKRKEREEKEEAKRKERDEKEKQKELLKKEKEMKEEQKRKEREDKEEQRRKEKEAREEEKRKRQETLELEKQEQELKKKKAAEAFANFFVPKQKVEREQSVGPVSKSSVLSSFAIKCDMRLAPTCRVNLSDDQRDELDKLMEKQDSVGYLKFLKDGAKPLSSEKTWPLSEKDENDVMIIEDELPPMDSTGEIITCSSAPREKLRPKLFSFHENRRPPYWGTWRKKSAFVKPRRPFGQEKQLDYEVDSDDDWEEEQEGESLDGSACGSDDEAGADDYEIDNEVFVPHGYLSDEEATMDEDDVMSLTPETQAARLKHLEDEFETELKKPTENLKPRLYGLLWENPDGGKPDNCVDALWNYFGKYSMIMNDITPLLKPSIEPEEAEKKKVKKKKVDGEEQSPKADKRKKTKTENKEVKKPKSEPKKTPVANQPGINSFLTKMKAT